MPQQEEAMVRFPVIRVDKVIERSRASVLNSLHKSCVTGDPEKSPPPDSRVKLCVSP